MVLQPCNVQYFGTKATEANQLQLFHHSELGEQQLFSIRPPPPAIKKDSHLADSALYITLTKYSFYWEKETAHFTAQTHYSPQSQFN